MSKINLNLGDSIVTKNQNGMKGIPVDARAQVQYYKDIQSIEYAYENLQVIVTDDDPTDSQHPKGIYVITKLDGNNDVDPSGIKSLKETVNVTKQDVGLENVDNVKQVPQTRTINNKPLNSNVTLNANDVGAIPTTQKGANDGVAELDNNGKLKSAQIPTTVATTDGLNQKVDKISNAEGNLPKINSSGNLEDSGFSIPTTENSDQILGYDSTLPGKLKWINKPIDGQNGDSAYQTWLDINQHQSTDPGYSETDFINSLKAHIGKFQYEDTDPDVVSSVTNIGDPVSSINSLIPGDGNNGTNNTLDVIVLMNNGDAVTPKTMMFSTSGDSTNGYRFYYVGDLQSAMPSNVLTQVDIVNDLTTGGIDNVLSAEQGKVLADTTLITQPTEQTINLKSDVVWLEGFLYINADGNLIEHTGVYKTSDYITLPSNTKTINYIGGTSTSSAYKQVAIYNNNNECLGTFFQHPATEGVSFDISDLVGATKMRISEYSQYVSGGTWDISVDVINIHSNQEVFEDFTQSVDDRFDEVNEHFENLDNNYYLADPVDVETNLKDSVEWVEGYNYINVDGTLNQATGVGKVSEYIDLLPNTKSIKYRGGVDTNSSHYHCAIYDAQDNCLATFRDSTVSTSNAVVFDITEYPTATKMRICEWINCVNNNTWDISVIHQKTQTNKETYDELLDWIDSLNQWKGKKFIVFGASNTSGGFSDGTSWMQMAAERLKMQPPISGMASRRVSLKYVDGALNLVGLAATIAECQSISASTTISYETQFAKDFDCVLFGGFAGESYDESQVVIDGTTYYGGEELIDLINLPTTRYNNNPQFTYSNGDTLAQHRNSYIGAVIYVLNELWKIKPTCRVVFTRAYLNWRNYDSFSKNFNGIKKLCDKLHLPFIDLVEGVYFNGFTTGTGADEDRTNPNIFLYDGEHASLAGRQRLGNIFTHKLLLIS